MCRIAVVTATRWEFRAVAAVVTQPTTRSIGGLSCLDGRCGANRILLVQAGVGPSAAACASRSLLSASPVDLVLSAGYACLLTTGQIGDVMTAVDVATRVRTAQGGVVGVRRCDERFHTWTAQMVARRGSRLHVGRVVSDSRVAVTAAEKREVALGTGAIGLDMESAAIAGVAADQHIPMGVLRVASDLLEDSLPLDFNLCFGPFGWARAAALCVARPSRLGGLMAFRRHAAVATASLTTVCGEVLGRYEAADGRRPAAERSGEC